MRLRFCLPTAAALAFAGATAAPALAETFWLSEPGLCKADDGVIEEMDAIYLTKTGINNHYFSCQWPEKAGEALLRGEQFVMTEAKCSTATATWTAKLEIVRQGNRTVRVFQETGGISPVRFFRCD